MRRHDLWSRFFTKAKCPDKGLQSPFSVGKKKKPSYYGRYDMNQKKAYRFHTQVMHTAQSPKDWQGATLPPISVDRNGVVS